MEYRIYQGQVIQLDGNQLESPTHLLINGILFQENVKNWIFMGLFSKKKPQKNEIFR